MVKSDVPMVILDPILDWTPGFFIVYLARFTWDAVHARYFEASGILDRSMQT